MTALTNEEQLFAESVIGAVQEQTGIDYRDLLYGRRKAADERRAIGIILREQGWSYPKIGAALDKDHASIYNMLNRACDTAIRESEILAESIVPGSRPVEVKKPSVLWQNDALCKGTPIEWFFEKKHKNKALAMCSKCPVKVECLNHRLITVKDKNEDSGIWGMTTAWERHKLRLASR